MMTEKMKREVATFGMTIQEMHQNKNSMFTPVEDPNEFLLHAMSILSDVQHMIETDPNRRYGGVEPRQYINQAKYWMSEHMHRDNMVAA